VETINFHARVKVGDEVGVWAELISVGRTSMRFRVSAWRRPHDSDILVKVTDAVFVFVALDETGKPPVIAKA
jgi:acyl-CoA thioesterase YciA